MRAILMSFATVAAFSTVFQYNNVMGLDNNVIEANATEVNNNAMKQNNNTTVQNNDAIEQSGCIDKTPIGKTLHGSSILLSGHRSSEVQSGAPPDFAYYVSQFGLDGCVVSAVRSDLGWGIFCNIARKNGWQQYLAGLPAGHPFESSLLIFRDRGNTSSAWVLFKKSLSLRCLTEQSVGQTC